MDKTSFSGDGVVTGSGLIAGRPVFVYSQDFTGGPVVVMVVVVGTGTGTADAAA